MKTIKFYLAIFIIFLLWSCSFETREVENVFIKGSDTEVNLALALAETYMAADPNISIAVTGGGSGAGIAALINNKTSIANSSRPMKEAEIDLANNRGIKPIASVFAMDALALIVHEDLPVNALSVEQIGAIFRGKIQNWRELGGPDMKISMYGRQSNSGTYVYFRDSILHAEYSQDVKQMNGTAQIVEGIKNDPAGIGYVGVGYVVKKDGSITPNIKVLSVKKDAHNQAFVPTKAENITNGDYPIVRPLFQYTDGRPDGKLRDFMLFCLSDAGQAIVKQTGYYPVSRRYWATNERVLNFSYADASSY